MLEHEIIGERWSTCIIVRIYDVKQVILNPNLNHKYHVHNGGESKRSLITHVYMHSIYYSMVSLTFEHKISNPPSDSQHKGRASCVLLSIHINWKSRKVLFVFSGGASSTLLSFLFFCLPLSSTTTSASYVVRLCLLHFFLFLIIIHCYVACSYLWGKK